MEDKNITKGNLIGTFIAILKAKGIEYFDRNILESVIFNYKNDARFKNILSCIKSKSNDLKEVLSTFNSVGIISTNDLDLSDPQAKIEDSPIKIMIAANINYFEEIMQFVDIYLYEVSKIEIEKQKEVYERYMEMEEASCRNTVRVLENMGTSKETQEKYQKLFRSID